MSVIHARRTTLRSCILLLTVLAGCHSSSTRMSSEEIDDKSRSTTTIAMPPKELVQRVKQIVAAPPIALPVERERDGELITGYQRFQGEWHIARHWQERTRYIINISPDWNEPLQKSRIDVTAQTQQRAASNQSFEDAPQLARPQRASDLLKEIRSRLNPDTATMPSTVK